MQKECQCEIVQKMNWFLQFFGSCKKWIKKQSSCFFLNTDSVSNVKGSFVWILKEQKQSNSHINRKIQVTVTITTMSDVCRVTLEAHWWLKTAPFGSRLEWWALGKAALSPISQESTLGYHSTSPGSTARSPPTSRASSPLCPPRLTSSTSQFFCCSPSSPSSSLSLSSHRNASFLLNITGNITLTSRSVSL